MPWFDERRLQRLEARVDYAIGILQEVMRSSHRLEQDRSMIMATLDDLVAEVAAEKTLDDSIIALINGLSAQLQAALASNDPAKVQAVLDGMKANAASLASALAANTPAAPAP